MNTTPFNEDWDFNTRMQPFADGIYQHIWKPSEIKRGLDELDKERGIDVILRLNSGLTLALQEKFRRNYSRKYQQFTIEYMNNPKTGEIGEFYKLAANYYFYGYARKDELGFAQWWIVDLNKFKESYQKSIYPDGIQDNQLRSHASFLYFDWSKLKDIVVFESEIEQLTFKNW